MREHWSDTPPERDKNTTLSASLRIDHKNNRRIAKRAAHTLPAVLAPRHERCHKPRNIVGCQQVPIMTVWLVSGR
jgi:hypothetical protein